MVDGCVDAFADDVMACGARGIISEPYTRTTNGHGAEIRKLLSWPEKAITACCHATNLTRFAPWWTAMLETARMSGGYMMCIGNHIPFNCTPEGVKRYLDLSEELAYR